MNISRHITGLFYAALTAVCLSSCLGSNDEAETVVNNYYNAIVTSFSLESNNDVCSNLSGYKFTIDNYGLSDDEIHSKFPDDGIIFNADSLPVGAIADSVKVSMQFSSPDSVYFNLYDPWGGLKQYSSYSKDSALYFASYPDCRLTLVSKGGYRKTYHIKINVHRVTGDTVAWRNYTDELWRDMNITDQRTDTLNGLYHWYVEEDGRSTKVSTSPIDGDIKSWQPMTAVEVADGDILDLGTLYNWHDKLYAIGKVNGKLLSTADGIHWNANSPEHDFVAVLGNQYKTKDVYGVWNSDSLNAIIRVDGKLHFATSADAQRWTIEQEIPANFPVRGFSRPIYTEARSNYGNLTSRLYITGGVTQQGTLVAGTWSCDGWNADRKGVNWDWFEQNEMPAMQGATVVEYTFDPAKPNSIWLLVPGITEAGTSPVSTFYGKQHSTLYYSEDHGVSWHRLSRRYTRYADNSPLGQLSCNSGFCSRAGYTLRFFGGRNDDGTFKTSVWGGQLNLLTFDIKK